MIIEKITETDIEEVSDLDYTERGVNGFGSSGLHKDIGKKMSCYIYSLVTHSENNKENINDKQILEILKMYNQNLLSNDEKKMFGIKVLMEDKKV